MTTAHEQIKQALAEAVQFYHDLIPDAESDVEINQLVKARDNAKNALALLDSHVVVPREPSNEILEAAADTSDEDLERAVRKKENMADRYKAMIKQATQEANNEL